MITQIIFFITALLSSVFLWRLAPKERQPAQFLSYTGSIFCAFYAWGVAAALLEERNMIAAYTVPWWAAGPILFALWRALWRDGQPPWMRRLA